MMVASSIVVVLAPDLARHFRQARMEAHDSTALRFTVRTTSNGGGAAEETLAEVEALWSAWRDWRHVVKQLQLIDDDLGI